MFKARNRRLAHWGLAAALLAILVASFVRYSTVQFADFTIKKGAFIYWIHDLDQSANTYPLSVKIGEPDDSAAWSEMEFNAFTSNASQDDILVHIRNQIRERANQKGWSISDLEESSSSFTIELVLGQTRFNVLCRTTNVTVPTDLSRLDPQMKLTKIEIVQSGSLHR